MGMATGRRKLFIKDWRKHRGLSQEALGALVGLTQGMISQLEKGTSDYTGRHLDLISEALRCSVLDLLSRSPKEDDPAALYGQLSTRGRIQAIEMLKIIHKTMDS